MYKLKNIFEMDERKRIPVLTPLSTENRKLKIIIT